MRTAIVAGATGLIGKQLTYKLLEHPSYGKIIILVRNLLNIQHPKLEQVIANFEDPTQMKIDSDIQDVYCCLGTTMAKAGSKEAFYKVDYTYVYNLAKHFSSRGALNFLLISANGANAASGIFYSRVKGEIETAVNQLSFQGIFIFRPSILVGNREEFRLGERIGIGFAMLLQPLMLGPLKKYRPIHAAKVAHGMILRALSEQTGTFFIESDQI